MPAPKDYEGLQKLEIRETGRFTATAANGAVYALVERTEFVYVTWPDQSKRSTPGAKTYTTLNGRAVTRLSPSSFQIVATGVALTRR